MAEESTGRKEKVQDAILITFDHRDRIFSLSLEERGVILTALYEHYMDGGINPDGDCCDMATNTWLVLDTIVGQVDRYLKTSKIRSIAGKLGGINSGASRRKAANSSKREANVKQKQAKIIIDKGAMIDALDINDPDYDDKVGEILYS